MPGTEFNFFTDIYCELNFLGDFTLSATECGNGPYVACDRFNGYSELFEGGCFTRSPGPSFFDSWLTCPDGPGAYHAVLGTFFKFSNQV